MERRGFLRAILAAGVAPAFVGSKILMPVKALVLPEWWVESEIHDSISIGYQPGADMTEIIAAVLAARMPQIMEGVTRNNAVLERMWASKNQLKTTLSEGFPSGSFRLS